MAADGIDALYARKNKARSKPKNASGEQQPETRRRVPPKPIHQKAAPKPPPAAEESTAPPATPETDAPKPPPAAEKGTASPATPETRPQAPEADTPAPPPAQGNPQPEGAREETPAPAPRTPKPSPAPAPAPAQGQELARRSVAAPAAASSKAAEEWSQYRPPPVPESHRPAEAILNERFIRREQLSASVPQELEITHRLDLLKVSARINQIPTADLVAVALDWFLRGGHRDLSSIAPPWCDYTGTGTDPRIPHAEDVLTRRFIERSPLKASVPEELELNHRLQAYKVFNRLQRVPPADIVAVAMDRWLRLMGF